ncbi:MAG: hypothetical protein JL56_07420 [Desulfotomaculum sp. BICA1-6]|nr:MAG: hypothetical protein JL56_07420 [Desulfotomaculum sp. BICA1-6]
MIQIDVERVKSVCSDEELIKEIEQINAKLIDELEKGYGYNHNLIVGEDDNYLYMYLTMHGSCKSINVSKTQSYQAINSMTSSAIEILSQMLGENNLDQRFRS